MASTGAAVDSIAAEAGQQSGLAELHTEGGAGGAAAVADIHASGFASSAASAASASAAADSHRSLDFLSAASIAAGYLPPSLVSPVQAYQAVPPARVLSPTLSSLHMEWTPARAEALAAAAHLANRPLDVIAILTEVLERACEARTVVGERDRSALASAFKSRLSSARGTLKMLGLVAEHETNPVHLEAVQAYARVMEANVLALATELIRLAETYQLPLIEDKFGEMLAAEAAGGGSSSGSAAAEKVELVEAMIFWFKLGADYCRYVSECHTDAAIVAQHSDMALRFYSKARQYSSAFMHPASGTALGVVLNFTVFLFEVRRCEAEACEIAKAAMEEAEAALSRGTAAPAYGHFSVKESEAVMRLIKENLRVWTQVLTTNALVV